MPREKISIHALRGEGDGNVTGTGFPTVISIHALRGEGDSTFALNNSINAISIHALRGEGDKLRRRQPVRGVYFNPRPPWGGRQAQAAATRSRRLFQSTPSVGRATTNKVWRYCMKEFQSTPSVGRATLAKMATGTLAVFQSTPSVGRAT